MSNFLLWEFPSIVADSNPYGAKSTTLPAARRLSPILATTMSWALRPSARTGAGQRPAAATTTRSSSGTRVRANPAPDPTASGRGSPARGSRSGRRGSLPMDGASGGGIASAPDILSTTWASCNQALTLPLGEGALGTPVALGKAEAGAFRRAQPALAASRSAIARAAPMATTLFLKSRRTGARLPPSPAAPRMATTTGPIASRPTAKPSFWVQARPQNSEQILRRLIGNWITYDAGVGDIADWVEKIYLKNDYSGFTGDRKFIRDDDAQKAFPNCAVRRPACMPGGSDSCFPVRSTDPQYLHLHGLPKQDEAEIAAVVSRVRLRLQAILCVLSLQPGSGHPLCQFPLPIQSF